MTERASTTAERGETGETLVEVLITILIVTIVFVALMAGFGTNVSISVIHNQQATSQTIARDFGEYLQFSAGAPYKPCGTTAQYASSALSNFRAAYKLPDGSTPLAGASPRYTIAVDSVTYWNGNISSAQFNSACAVDLGTQRIDFTVASAANPSIKQALQVVKRQ